MRPEGPAEPTTSIGELVGRLSSQISALLRGEIQLAQIQLAEKGKRLGRGGALFAVAGVLALYALGILLLAAVWGIAVALPLWLSALIVGVVLLIIAAIIAFFGKKQVDKQKHIKVEPQVGLKEDVDAFKKGLGK